MLKRLIAAAAIVAFAYAAIPANAAKVSAGCSGDNLGKTETMIENMADGEGKMMAQKEIAAAQDAHAQRQDGRLRDASEQGDARGHGEVSLRA